MIEMLRIYSKGFLENVTIGELPPAIFLYGIIVQGVTKVPLHEVARGIVPFVAAYLFCLAFLIAFP
jgi:TRAP-type C4-dicarboxylate transport system permease large subunit